MFDNTFIFTKVIKLLKGDFQHIVCPQMLNLLVSLIKQKGIYMFKMTEDFKFLFHYEYSNHL